MSDSELRGLVSRAIAASQLAYAPYSNYSVGAALLTPSGQIYTGCNVENASYPVTICAERVALVKAVSEGVRQFDSIAVVTRDGGSPCGMCRQMLYEFAPHLRVILADINGTIKYDGLLTDLLPLGFNNTSLNHATP